VAKGLPPIEATSARGTSSCLRVVVTADSTATTGPRSLTVTNTDAGKVTATNAVTVT